MKYLVVSLMYCVLFGSQAVAQMSSQSFLEQIIQPVECEQTNVEVGSGLHSTWCPAFSPAIHEIAVQSGRPMISGVYNSMRALSLRIHANGVWYVLGFAGELTVSGNTWLLDLSSLDPPLSPGSYMVTVQVADIDGRVRSDAAWFVVAVDSSNPDDEESEGPRAPGTGAALDAAPFVLLGSSILAISVFVFLWTRRLSADK